MLVVLGLICLAPSFGYLGTVILLRARLDGLNKSSFKKVLLKVLKLIFKISSYAFG